MATLIVTDFEPDRLVLKFEHNKNGVYHLVKVISPLDYKSSPIMVHGLKKNMIGQVFTLKDTSQTV